MSRSLRETNRYSREPPINQLPHELLASIFLLVHSHARSNRCDTGARSCLAFVCRLWYEVVLSTPELWDYVSISHSVSRLSTHLALSKQTPVDVSIDIRWGSIGAQAFERSLGLLKEHWHHLQSLRVLLHDSGYARMMLDEFNHATRLRPQCILEEIHIDLITGKDAPGDQAENDVLYLFLPTSQRLRCLELRGLNTYPVFLRPSDVLSGLRELVLEETTAAFISKVLLAFLSLTPNLTSLSLHERARGYYGEEVPNVANISTIPSISLPHLQSLSIVNIPQTSVDKILGKLDMTNLRSFKFHTSDEGTTSMDWATVNRYHELTKLSFKGLSITQMANFLPWLERLDDLEEFEMYSNDHVAGSTSAAMMATALVGYNWCLKLKSFDVHVPTSDHLRECMQIFRRTRPSVSVGGHL